MDTPDGRKMRARLNTEMNIARKKRMYIERRTGRASFQDRLTDLLPAAIILGLKDVTVFAPVHWTDDARVAAQRMMETCQEMELDSRLVWEGGSCRLVVVVPSGGRNW